MKQSQAFTALVDAATLVQLLRNSRPSNMVVFDTRFSLSDPEYGMRVYSEGHIPSAFYLHLDRDLSSPITSSSGRHPLPFVDSFVEVMRRHGVSADTQVIVYDDAAGMFAARCWWLLKWLGHENVAVLDGGLAAWLRHAGNEDVSATELPARGNFQPRARPELLIDTQGVEQGLAKGTMILCDARAPERFRGDVEPLDKAAGHVPGALNQPFAHNLDAEGCFKGADELREMHTRTIRNHTARNHTPHSSTAVSAVSPGTIVHMCGSGVTACHNVLATVVAGLPMPKLYAGSWSEWITDRTRQVAKG